MLKKNLKNKMKAKLRLKNGGFSGGKKENKSVGKNSKQIFLRKLKKASGKFQEKKWGKKITEIVKNRKWWESTEKTRLISINFFFFNGSMEK